ncbi:MAG: hypothetical protein HDS16_04930 [Bacteroides sp.]|nr:hypothetical protein [Bacteroides sp.]
MKRSQKIYNLYRKTMRVANEIEDMKGELTELEDALKIADTLADRLFECVGKAAAYEIDEENNYQEIVEE